jgi:hypothetical protein
MAHLNGNGLTVHTIGFTASKKYGNVRDFLWL